MPDERREIFYSPTFQTMQPNMTAHFWLRPEPHFSGHGTVIQFDCLYFSGCSAGSSRLQDDIVID